MSGWTQPRIFAHAASLVPRARGGHLRPRIGYRPGRNAAAQLRPPRGISLHHAQWLRLRLGELSEDAASRERPDRLGRMEKEASRCTKGRPLAWNRHRDDARLWHQQLRPITDRESRAALLRQFSGRKLQARYLRRSRRCGWLLPAG